MKKLFVAAFLGVLFAATQAHAVFTYIPEGQAPASPIIQENASDVFAGNPMPQAAPLVVPPAPQMQPAQAAVPSQSINPKVGIGSSTASPKEISQAEALIQKARRYEGNSGAVSAQAPKRQAARKQAAQPAPQPAIQPVYQPAMPAYMANAMVQGAPPLVVGKGSLREQLIRYAGSMGYQVAWNCPNDLIVTNETVFSSGTFAGNLRELFETLQRIGRRDMSATLFQGNRTIVVEPARR